MSEETFTSKAKHPDGQDLDMYKMSFFDCNADVPIVGEEFNIKMGGVKYEVTDEPLRIGHLDPNKYEVKHNGVVLDGLLFDIDPTSKTVPQLVGLADGCRQFRSAHVARVTKLTSPKKKRTAKTAASELAKKSAGGSAVSPA